MAEKKKYLNEDDFKAALDKEMGTDPWLVAFAPIRIVSAGGFLAVSYLKNRDATGDLDYLMDPEFARDEDVQKPFQDAILSVAAKLQFVDDWVNEAMAIFVTKRTREIVFEGAAKQGITLFKGENLEVLAAPLEWALERKLRRIHAGDRGRKAELDMSDAIAMLKKLRERNNGPLDLEVIRTMNLNGFDVLPDHGTMQRVAEAYCQQYNEDIFG
ncbi:uncharacterized protein DSM5745_06824 [Aspergillus mulundensis]|uniref:Uncharacterized protein n=1 Tax=Aspergillus mulundensis TaxID=1810919 RepID=A0A3D8RRY1_9EURO|nr:hypothetical protein DSM5745_06824 [Aspergillus mulundensis]RDW76832.1 hypothetical protein DSM5745_06824 [Aspergillus mulundensis]